jgi:hypothetical protein
MTRDEFYRGKTVQVTEWWLSQCDDSQPTWARIRVFDDGTADAGWEEGGTLYGFENRDCASYFIAEDEYSRFDRMDDEDQKDYELNLREISPPSWNDEPSAGFEYLGKY